MERFDLLYYRTGPSATVSVMKRPDGVRFLTINGKTDASNSYKSDMPTQVMIGQLPMLYHPDPKRVLVIGLGSGVTAGSVLTHPAQRVDCVEISSAVADAARFFDRDNHGALNDPRLHVIRRDARNHLLTSRTDYDVIVSQPSNPWVNGEANLFSLEWYRIVRDRLGSGGLLVQWLPTYSMAERDLKTILHTMRTVFPNISLWTSGAVGDVVILASKGVPLRIDYPKLLERGSRPEVSQDLARLGMIPALVPTDLFIMNRDELSAYLYGDGNAPPLNTDNSPHIEFGTPKRMAEGRKVARFMISENLRGKAERLAEMVVSMDPGVMTAILRGKDTPNM
jgi:spermidine synthase